MSHRPPNLPQDEQRLGHLAMQFRGTRHEAERKAIAEDYSQTVERLIRGGGWGEMPAPEDQLPDRWMPEAFFEYWAGRQATP